MMRKFYMALAAVSPLLIQAAPLQLSQLAGCKLEGHQLVIDAGTSRKAPVKGRVTVEEIFAAPEGTVLDGPYDPETAYYTGSQCADQGRPDMPTIFYQAFHGCYKTVNEVRFIGLFKYWDEEEYNWIPCLSRGGIQEDYEMTEPIRIEVGFYRADDEGKPGEEIYRKQFDVIGRYMGVTVGMEGEETPLYEFRVKLDKEIRLESGFCAFSAANTGETPSCWLNLFTASSSLDFAYLDMGEEYGLQYAMLPAVFSFMGDGLMAAAKALRVDNLSAPGTNSCGTHEKVTVRVVNVGSQTMDDATLELWVDGQGVTTETIPVSIEPEASFTYTFKKRVDLSKPGEHKVEVRNATRGDEKISKLKAVVSTATMEEGDFCESYPVYPDERVSITRVKFGTVDNASEIGTYSDYFDEPGCSADIRPGETLQISREPVSRWLAGVWVDWNGDGLFDGPGEEIGYMTEEAPYDVLDLRIPEGINVSAGPKRLRMVIGAGETPVPCGERYYGETEDYALNVVRNSNQPSLDVDLAEIAEESPEGDARSAAFNIANEGDAEMNVALSVNYTLPEVYEPRNLAPVSAFRSGLKVMKKAQLLSEPSSDEVAHVLKYDGGHSSAVSLGNYESAIFGSYWPAAKLGALKGMKISSVDVYIEAVPGAAKIKIFGPGEDSNTSGELLLEQAFEPQESSWNTVSLATPLEITGTDLWIGVEMSGMSSTLYHIGIDGLPAVAGYGDVCNVGGNYWWSMSALGIDSNFCVRANVTGELTPYLSWLTLDSSSLSVKPGEKATVNARMNPENLATGTYEASIELRTNDELNPCMTMPVYFVSGVLAGIDAAQVAKASVKFTAEGIVLSGQEAISSVSVADLSGRVILNEAVGASSAVIPVDALASGVYVLSVTYVDGTVESAKVALSR